jgi:hypothetical protein
MEHGYRQKDQVRLSLREEGALLILALEGTTKTELVSNQDELVPNFIRR